MTSFARKTGDIAVLSTADIRVLALCLTIEIEENGTWRVRDHPGQVLTGPPKSEGEPAPTPEDAASAAVAALSLDATPDAEPVASTSGTSPPRDDAPEVVDEPESADVDDEERDGNDSEGDDDEGDDDEGAESDDSHDSSSSWITPDNVTLHKVKDLGLFAPPENDSTKPPKTIMKAAVLTGDFAMQNVALQMGLNVLGSGGKRVREVRTWVLRCHACYKCVTVLPLCCSDRC